MLFISKLITIILGIPTLVYVYKSVILIAFQKKIIYCSYLPLGNNNPAVIEEESKTLQKEAKQENYDLTFNSILKPKHSLILRRKQYLHGFCLSNQTISPSSSLPMAILIYFQGNAGNLYLRKDKLFQLLSLVKPHFPLKIVAYHLSGYGDSDGKSNEYELKKDALLVYDTVKKEIIENNVNDYKLIIYGHSLGAAVSLHLSSQRKVDGLILENGISSIEGMVKYMYPRWLPYRYLTKWFLTEKWDGKKAIEEINEKKKKKRQAETEYLFLLSENDSMVPSTMSKEMFEALESKQKQFMGFNHANHDNIYLQTGYKSEVLNFFKRVMKK